MSHVSLTLMFSAEKKLECLWHVSVGGLDLMQLWYANAHADPDSETPDHSACMRALRIHI